MYDEAERNLRRQENHRPDTPTFIAALCQSDLIVQQEEEFISNRYAALTIMYTLGNNVVAWFPTYDKICSVYACGSWKKGIEMHTKLLKRMSDKDERSDAREEIIKYTKLIQKYEPTYEAPETSSNSLLGFFRRTK